LPADFGACESAEDTLQDSRSFYFDLALASAPELLDLVLKTFPVDRILSRSDTPYDPEPVVLGFDKSLDSYPFIKQGYETEDFEGECAIFVPKVKEVRRGRG